MYVGNTCPVGGAFCLLHQDLRFAFVAIGYVRSISLWIVSRVFVYLDASFLVQVEPIAVVVECSVLGFAFISGEVKTTVASKLDCCLWGDAPKTNEV